MCWVPGFNIILSDREKFGNLNSRKNLIKKYPYIQIPFLILFLSISGHLSLILEAQSNPMFRQVLPKRKIDLFKYIKLKFMDIFSLDLEFLGHKIKISWGMIEKVKGRGI